MKGRSLCITQKVKTDFGTAFIQIDLSEDGRPTGGRIATPGKSPESQVDQLIEAISNGLDAALAAAGGVER